MSHSLRAFIEADCKEEDGKLALPDLLRKDKETESPIQPSMATYATIEEICRQRLDLEESSSDNEEDEVEGNAKVGSLCSLKQWSITFTFQQQESYFVRGSRRENCDLPDISTFGCALGGSRSGH